jgi:hypothetical protein
MFRFGSAENIRMRYNHAEVVLNWECNYDLIQVDDMSDVEKGWDEREYGKGYNGRIPENEFADIEWYIGADIMLVKVNGELRYIGGGDAFFSRVASSAHPEPVRINPAWGSTVTVESLRISEL